MNAITEVPITQAEREALSVLPQSQKAYRYSYHVDPSIKSARLYVEGWREGVYQGAWGDYILPVDKQEGNITLSQEFSVTGSTRGTEWTVLGPSGAGVGFSAQLPSDFNASSSAAAFLFSGEEEGIWPIRIYEEFDPTSSKSAPATNPVILGAVAFTAGNLIRSYECQFLMENPDYIAKYEYVYLFKCVFSTKDVEELEAERAAIPGPAGANAPGPAMQDKTTEASPGPAMQEKTAEEIVPSPTASFADDASITLIQGGKAVRTVSIKDNTEYQDLAQRVIFGHLVLSAAWPAVDVESFEDRIELYANVAEGALADTHYIFLQDGKPCVQSGKDGMWTFMQEELYQELYAVASGENTPSVG